MLNKFVGVGPGTRGSVMKNPPSNSGDAGSIPGSGGSPGGGSSNPLQYSCLENSVDRGLTHHALITWLITHVSRG